MPLVPRLLHNAVSSVWLFACDHAIIPVLATTIAWLEDHAWLNNPRQRAIDRLTATMDSTEDYQTWAKCAERLDRLNGLEQWGTEEDSARAECDWGMLQRYVETSQEVLEQEDVARSMHMLASWPHRGASGLLTDAMFKYTSGTKLLVDEYFREVEELLRMVVRSPDIRAQDKYVFFKRIAQNHGRTALMLSGGASLGMYHLGVLKALWQADLMPKVITGSSAGSIIAAFLCSRPHSAIDEMFWTNSVSATLEQMQLHLDAFDPFGPKHAIRRMFWRLIVGGALMDVGRLAACIRSNIGDITFLEAYEVSGRVLSVTVTSTREFQSTLILNYLTAPNVLVRTAVCASCAVSGVFSPVELLAKNAEGEIVPYCPSRQQWCDGSINMDLPLKRMSELFNINYVIVSQVNPHVIPFLDTSMPGEQKGLISRLQSCVYKNVCSELKHVILQSYRLGLVPAAFGPIIKILEQDYLVGNVNILPVQDVAEVVVSIQNPTPEYMEHCLSQGQRRTWPYLTKIRYNTRLEHVLDDCFDQIVLGLMNEYERISTRVADDEALTGVGRQPSTVTAYGSNSSLSDGLASNPMLKPWRQDLLALWDPEEADEEEETQKIRKLRDSHYVLERLHTFHPAKSHRRSHCSSSMSPSPSVLKPLSGMTLRANSDFQRSFQVPRLDLTAARSDVQPRKKLLWSKEAAISAMTSPVPLSLPAVLNWIELHVATEHKMRVAQYAVAHTEEVAAVIDSGFERKEALIVQMVASPSGIVRTATA